MLNGKIKSAPVWASGFDTDTVLTALSASALAVAGYTFCARYLSLEFGQRPGDLSQDEAQIIIDAGLGLFAVQHVPSAGWVPDPMLGVRHGLSAASNATEAGLPFGTCVALDLEGVAESAASIDVAAYCHYWYQEVYASDYLPMLYVGANQPLTGPELYDLPFERYWRSASAVPNIPHRGYCLVQGVSRTVQGVNIDPDTAYLDNEGCGLVWAARNG